MVPYTSTEILATWLSVHAGYTKEIILGYVVKYKQLNTLTMLEVLVESDVSYLYLKDLFPNTAYVVDVYAYNSVGLGHRVRNGTTTLNECKL